MTSIITRLHHITGYGTAARVPDDSRVSVEAKVINEAAETIAQALSALKMQLSRLEMRKPNGFASVREWAEACLSSSTVDRWVNADADARATLRLIVAIAKIEGDSP